MRWFFKLVLSVLKYFDVRIIEIPMVVKGIGHQITEACTFIKRQQLGLIPPSYRLIVFFSLDLTYSKFNKPHVNHHLIKYLKTLGVVTVFEYSESLWEKVKFTLFSRIVYQHHHNYRLYYRLKSLLYDVNYYMSLTDRSAAMFETSYYHRNALFQIQKSDLKYGQKILEKLGLPEDAWFVSFHYRENSFYKAVDFWEANYNNRCVDAISYQPALEAISRKGGYSFRIAAKNSEAIPFELSVIPNVFDIHDIDGDVDRFCVFLLARSRFFLCCNSGPSILAGFFGVPAAQSQTAPFYGASLHHHDLMIFKKYKKMNEDRFLNIDEMMSAPYSYIRLDRSYQKYGIQVVDNTPEEILDLVEEMLEQTDPKVETQENNYVVSNSTSKDVYCYKSPAKFSRTFFESLRQEKELLDAEHCYSSSSNA